MNSLSSGEDAMLSRPQNSTVTAAPTEIDKIVSMDTTKISIGTYLEWKSTNAFEKELVVIFGRSWMNNMYL
ncbi:MAG: hypothetical protein WA323_28400 [Candidatus Nitrosopolaris sp.]